MGASVAATSGPVLGGILTLVSWRLIFFINLPAGAVALTLLARAPRSPHRQVPVRLGRAGHRDRGDGRAHLRGDRSGRPGFSAPAWSAPSQWRRGAVVFLATQARGVHPMMPLELFRSRNVSVAVAVGFAFMVGFYGLPFLMSLYLQQLRGLSPLATGWRSCQ